MPDSRRSSVQFSCRTPGGRASMPTMNQGERSMERRSTMIPMLDLAAQYRTLQPEIDRAMQEVAAGGQYILGANVSAFEQEIAAFLGAPRALGCASGTDALFLALKALGIG